MFLDVRNPDAPTVSEPALPTTSRLGRLRRGGRPGRAAGFYVSHRKQRRKRQPPTAAELHPLQVLRPALGAVAGWFPLDRHRQINTPGRLIRTWKAAEGTRMLLSQDHQYRWVALPSPQQGTELRTDARLSLMRQMTLASGQPAAEFLDGRAFTNLNLGALMLAGDNQDRLVIGAQPVRGGTVTGIRSSRRPPGSRPRTGCWCSICRAAS